MHPVLEWLKENKITSKEGSSRWYKDENTGVSVPSVTTVLNVVAKGPHFDKWLANHLNYEHACVERDRAAERGTLVHELVENLLEGTEILLDPELDGNEIIKRIMCFEKWWKETPVEKVIAKEVGLHYPGIHYAGRFDFIARINGRNVLIDIKTGNHYKTHDLQASMYKILWDTICEHLALSSEYYIDDLYGLYLKDSWVKAPNPQYKKLKFIPREVGYTVGLWNYINSNAYGKVFPPKTKEKYPLTYKLKEFKYDNEKADLDNIL